MRERESPRVAVVTAWAIREPNKNPMSKICLGQTPPAKKKPADCSVLRDAGFLFHIFVVLSSPSDSTLFVSFPRRSARSTSTSGYRCICKHTAERGLYECFERCVDPYYVNLKEF